MRAAVYYENGGPEVFRYETVPDPVPGPDDVLLEVEAVSVEGGDTLNRSSGALAHVPHVVGYQCAGTVLSTGGQVTGIEVGDRVVTLGLDGSHAELRVAGQSFCWVIPAGLSTEEAACVPTPFGTASDCLFEFGRTQPGETVLIHAGASGVGIAAIQLAKRAWARVLATASSDDRLARLVEFGLDQGINYAKEDFVQAVREGTEGRGADVIIDSVGGSTLQKSLHSLAYRGRCVSFGNAGREGAFRLDVSGMTTSNQTLTGYFLGAELFFTPRPHAVIASLLQEIALGDLRVVIDRRFPLEDAGEAHAYIESRQAFGRVVLLPHP
jgi:NADPH2:quinone reductase